MFHIHADHLELKGPIPGGSLSLLTSPGFLTLTACRHSASIPSFLTLVHPCRFHTELPKLKAMSHTCNPPHQGCPPLIPSPFITRCPRHHLVPRLSLCTQATISTAFSCLFIHPSSFVKVYRRFFYKFSLSHTLVIPCIHKDDSKSFTLFLSILPSSFIKTLQIPYNKSLHLTSSFLAFIKVN